jgi:hypothetical protein
MLILIVRFWRSAKDVLIKVRVRVPDDVSLCKTGAAGVDNLLIEGSVSV